MVEAHACSLVFALKLNNNVRAYVLSSPFVTMLMQHSMIDDQLTVIAATVDSAKQLLAHDKDEDTQYILPKLFTRWRQITRRAIEEEARDRAWRSIRTQQALVKSLGKWATWLQGNRRLGARQVAREAAAQAHRYLCTGPSISCFVSRQSLSHSRPHDGRTRTADLSRTRAMNKTGFRVHRVDAC